MTEQAQDQELNYIWLPNLGAPLFLADDADVIKRAIDAGFSVFFVLGQKSSTTGTGTFTRTKHTPQLFKVVKNLVGEAITAVDDLDMRFAEIKEQAWFHLPAIPWSLISDIDDFFREIDRRHGTEAIVLFTYDPAYTDSENPSDGWGVLVPKQENSAASCHYDPTSVVDDKPEEVYIVGSAHSHPGMSAFASHTDINDQADFDGIHITFGWKKGSAETEFHIELQMGGGRYNMKEADIFVDRPPQIENDRIQAWTEKVTKAPPRMSYGGGDGYGGYYSDSGGSKYITETERKKYTKLPSHCPYPISQTVIAKTFLPRDQLKECPVCDARLMPSELDKVRCNTCMVYLQWEGLSYEEFVDMRKRTNLTSDDIDISRNPYRSIWVYEQSIADDGKLEGRAYKIWPKEVASGKA